MATRKPARSKTKKRKRPAKPRTCGDLGGTGLTGAPCTHLAGWGTEHRGEGRCAEHDEDQAATLQAHKKKYVELLASGDVSLMEACESIGRNPSTIWRWRQADSGFDAEVTTAQTQHDKIRVKHVEDSLYLRCRLGLAKAAEVIFFLKNRDPERWKDRQIRTLEGAVGIEQTIREIAADDGNDAVA
jgi:hypothetical protein